MTILLLHPQIRRDLATLPAADLTALALAAHRAQCRTCAVETCPTGQALEQAARPDLGWIRSPEGT